MPSFSSAAETGRVALPYNRVPGRGRSGTPNHPVRTTQQIFVNSNTRNLVPMAFVKSVPRSIAFCEKFGFRVRNTRAPEGAVGPVIAEKPATLFYLYVDDAAAFRAQLLASGA